MHDNGPVRPARLKIGSLDLPDDAHTVTAHYNPKDIDLAQQSNWSDEGNVKGMVKNDKLDPYTDIQYTGSVARTMTLELFLDQFEGLEPNDPRTPVDVIVRRLQELASPIDEFSDDPWRKRPHMCVVVWGPDQRFPRFNCVIESLAVKYTMFALDGSPVRAVCTLKLKEARTSRELRKRGDFKVGDRKP